MSDGARREVVHTTSAGDSARSISALTLAFASDPVFRYFYSDESKYLAHYPGFAAAFGGKAFDCGSAQHLDGFTGAALWLPPGVSPDDEPLVNIFRESCEPRKFQVVLKIREEMGNAHPVEPHWYLSLIGVAPDYQDRGLGGALLGAMIKEVDGAGLPAYLESTNVRNLTLYERFGFERLGLIQVDDCPPMFPMFRPRRQAANAPSA
jgi:ribosomal protein S18 acetylase RimI-like enzyme